MARAGRQKSSSGVYHVLLRGVDKLFLEDSDYIEFRARLAEYFAGEVKLLAFALLQNRVHLLIDEGGHEVSKAVKPLCTSYARYFNRTHSVDGKLFYDRYKSVPCDSKAEIADAYAFINAIGKEFAKEENSSAGAASKELCDTKRVKVLIGDVKGLKPFALHMDDYSQLSKADMERYLMIVAGCKLSDLSKMDRQSDEFKKIFSGGVTARAVLPLYNVKPATDTKKKKAPAPKKAPVPKVEEIQPEPKKEEKPAPKRDLSVWLL